MHPKIAPLEFQRSDRFHVVDMPPEEVIVKLGPPPARAPFIATFSPAHVHDEPDMKSSVDHESWKLVAVHFVEPVWVRRDGTISYRLPLWRRLLWPARRTSLRIDFGFIETGLNGLRLMPIRTPVSRLTSPFPCDPWRLMVCRDGYPTWHDAIIHENGHFKLASVANQYEKRRVLKPPPEDILAD
ncbi:MAG: hypothetical protein KGI79_00425 [Patescibacteria group bacterium]|nr:hypothetical protein [Patescibacteria group bacterium]MDE2116331.1 hypothetical protein [Patescibacteria group bacterium]